MTTVPRPAPTSHTGLPTSRGIEHLSMTVADLDEATAFFTDVLGCETLYTMGPFAGVRDSFIRIYANSDVRSVVHHVRVLRSPFLNVELFLVTTPRQQPVWPDLYDIGGWCLTARVDDVDAATAYLDGTDVFTLGPGHCMTRFGLHLRLVGAPSDHGGLWDPADPDRGAAPAFEHGPGALPGFRGFERLQVTVADLDEASAVFEDVLGFEACRDVPAPADADGLPLRASANVDARARPSRARVLRSPFLNVELVECPPFPGQRTLWPAMFDVGGWHLAVYIDDVDTAYSHLGQHGVHLLGEKKPSYHEEAGVDAYTVHALAPFGLLFELVTYPHGRDGEATRTTAAWHPGHPTR